MFLTKLLVYPMTLLMLTQGSVTVSAELYSKEVQTEIITAIASIDSLSMPVDKEIPEEKIECQKENLITQENNTLPNKEEDCTVIEKEEISEIVIEEESSEVEHEKETPTIPSSNLYADFIETTTEKVTETITFVEEKTTEQITEDLTSTNNLYHPFIITGYSAETFNKVCEGTYLEGFGQYLVNLENEYGVNGMFCLGVARAESGMGSSSIAKNKNNYFGIMGSNGAVTYSSGEECIMSFGRLMNKSIYKGKTIEQIGPIYCESSRWPSFVRECMAYNFNKIN